MKKQNISFKTLTFISLSFTLACGSQKDNLTDSWKNAKFEKISFKYPADWTFKKQTSGDNTILSATPDTLNDMSTLFIFEVMQLNPHGHSFAEFKKDFIPYIAARSQNEMEVLNRKDTVFKNLQTDYAQVKMFYKSDRPIPATVYAINGEDKIYMITILGLRESYPIAPQLNKITSDILNTIKIEK